MTSRLSALSLQSLCRTKSLFNVSTISFFNSKLKCYSSVPNIRQPVKKNLRFPKAVQSFANQSVDDILSSINEESVSPEETISILKAIRMQILFQNADSEIFKKDAKFEALCNIFEKECSNLRPALLVSGLRSLLEVGVPPNATCVTCAEENIMKNICLFSSFNIIGCLYFHHKYMETDLQRKVVSALVSELCRRVYEISTPPEILMLVHFLHVFKSEEDLKVIQQQIVEVLPQLSKNELCKVLATLSETSTRNIYILKAITFQLLSKINEIDLKDVLSILYSFKNLNFEDVKFLAQMLQKVPEKIPSVTQPSVISGILTTCGHLRWKQPGLAKACGEWICNHLDSCRPKEFVSFILYGGTVNLTLSEVQNQVKTMLPYISLEKVQSSDIWLDVVWSLAILQIVDKDMLLQVLSSDFYNSLISGTDHQTVTNKLKLLNLKAVLKIHHPECFFNCNLFIEPPQISPSSEVENSKKYLIKVLGNFIPKDNYLSVNQYTDIGVNIDAEFIVDKNVKPLPLADYGLLSNHTDKTLPEGCHRIALLILFYKDYTLHTSSMSGCYALASTLLRAQGYTVIRIPFEEFTKNTTEVKKAKYLLNKITRAINPSSKK